MSEETKKEKQTSKTKRKRRLLLALNSLLVLIGMLLLVELSFLYFGGMIFHSVIKKFVEQESRGVYDINYESLHIEPITGYIHVNGFEASSDIRKYNQRLQAGDIETSLYDVSLQELKLEGLSLRKLLFKDELILESLTIRVPTFRILKVPEKKSDADKLEILKRDIYYFVKPYFRTVQIDRFDLEQGFFSLENSAGNFMTRTGAEQISFNIQGFLVNSEAYHKKDNLFYSEVIHLNIHNYSLKLNDDLHQVSVGKIVLAPHDSLVLIENARLKPLRESRSDMLYNMQVPMLKVSGIDLYNAWSRDELFLKHIMLYRPTINIREPLGFKSGSTKGSGSNIERRSGSLYAMIDGLLKSLSFEEFVIDAAEFSVYRGNERIPGYDVSEFNMSMTGFLLDSLSHKRLDRIFFSEDIGFSFKNLKFKIINNSHFIDVDSLYASTGKKNLTAYGLEIHPRTAGFSAKQNINISLESLTFEAMDFIRAFNYGELKIDLLHARNPKVDIQQKKYGASGNNVDADLAYLLVSDFVHTFQTNTIRISDASLSLKQIFPYNRQASYKGNLDLELHQFLLNKKTALATDNLFMAENFDLSLSDFSLKTANDFHALELDFLRISSSDSVISLKRMKYTPDTQSDFTDLMLQYNKSLLSDIFIDRMTVSGLDLKNAIYNKSYTADRIFLQDFSVFLRQYPQLKPKKEEKKKFYFKQFIPENTGEIPINPLAERTEKDEQNMLDSVFAGFNKFLSEQINRLDVSNINLSNGYVYFALSDTLTGVKHYIEGNISGRTSGLRYIDSLSDTQRPALAGNFQIALSDLKHFNSESNLNIKAESFRYANNDSALQIEQFRLMPADKSKADTSKALLYVYAPRFEIEDLSPHAFFHKSRLQTGKIKIPKLFTDIELPDRKRATGGADVKVFRLPKIIKTLGVQALDIDEGRLAFRHRNSDSLAGQTRFALHVNDISDDPKNYSFPLKYSKARLHLGDLFYRMPDGLNILKSDSIYFSMDSNYLYAGPLFFGPDSVAKAKELAKDRPEHNNLTSINTRELKIRGIDILKLVFDRYVNLSSLEVIDPAAEIIRLKKPDKKTDFGSVRFEKRLQKNLRDAFSRFRISDLQVRNASVNFSDHTEKQADSLVLERLNAQILGFAAQRDPDDQALFLADDIRFSLRHFSHDLPEGFYRLSFDEAAFSLKDSSLHLRNMALLPLTGKYEFGRKMGYQKSRLDLRQGDLQLKGLDFRTLIDEQDLFADSLFLKNAHLYVFKDKHIPEDTLRRPPGFRKALMSIVPTVSIRHGRLENLDVVYEQNSEKYEKTGDIAFYNINGNITNISNDTARINKGEYMRARLGAKLQNEADMRVSFRFPLDTSENYVFVGLTDTFDLRIINDFIENTVLLSVERGKTNKMSFHVSVYDDYAQGRMHFFYNNLKVSVLDTSASRRGFTSAIANVILPGDNPGNRFSKIREGTIYAKAIPYKNEFHLWSQAVLSGALSSINFESDEVKEHRKFLEKVKRVLDREERQKARRIRQEKKRMEQELDED